MSNLEIETLAGFAVVVIWVTLATQTIGRDLKIIYKRLEEIADELREIKKKYQ
jgi:hypothetical protein